MRISTNSILSVRHTKSILKMIPVCSVITDGKPRIIEDFDCTSAGQYMQDTVDQDANSTFAAKIRNGAISIKQNTYLFFANVERFEDEWWGIYQVRYLSESPVHLHLLWQSFSAIITQNEALSAPFEVHFEMPGICDKQKVKDLFSDTFSKSDLKGEYVLHVVGE